MANKMPWEEDFESSPEPQSNAPSEKESFVRGAAQEYTFGIADEVTGAAEAALDVARGKAKLRDAASAYKKRRDESRAAYAEAEKANPKSYVAGQVAGGVAQAFTPGLGIAGTAGKVAKVGKLAAQGAARGVGYSEAEDVKGLASDAATGAATNLAAGAATSKLSGMALQKGAQATKATARGVEKAATKSTELIEKVSPEIRAAAHVLSGGKTVAIELGAKTAKKGAQATGKVAQAAEDKLATYLAKTNPEKYGSKEVAKAAAQTLIRALGPEGTKEKDIDGPWKDEYESTPPWEQSYE